MNSIPIHFNGRSIQYSIPTGRIYPKMDCKSTQIHNKTINRLKKKHFYSKVYAIKIHPVEKKVMIPFPEAIQICRYHRFIDGLTVRAEE